MAKPNNNHLSQKVEVPFITRTMLAPAVAPFSSSSPHTQQNLKSMSKVLAFTVSVSGGVLGASITQFALSGNPWTYLVTIPAGVCFYGILDRMVVMTDTNKNADFIRRSRYAIAGVLGLYASFLIDTKFYQPDIEAERAKEIVVAQAKVQQQADREKKAYQLHKEDFYRKIKEAQAPIKERSNELIKEVEGAGFSGNAGKGKIYQVKYEAFVRDSIEVERQIAVYTKEVKEIDRNIIKLDSETTAKKKQVPTQISTGALKTLDLLHHVVMRKPFNMFVSLLFLLMCMILELLPLLAKFYIDIGEYFEHVRSHVEAYLANKETNKQHTIKKERHRSTLSHNHDIQALSNRYALAHLTQQAAHSEDILHEVEKHFATVVPLETLLATRYPAHFPHHIAPVFVNVYDSFKDSHPKAFHKAPLITEAVQ